MFDPDAADRAITFIKALRHTKGEFANKRFLLQPFQAFIIASIFGWIRKDNGKRRYTKAYIEVARKNGKTELAAAIGVYMQFADKEQGAEVYSAATKKDQSKICFKAAAAMVRKMKAESPTLDKMITVGTAAVSMLQNESTFQPLAADSDTEDGLNPHCGIIDEYHAHKTDGMVKILETGMGARLQPLLLIITTAGYNRQSPCYKFRSVCINYLEGVLRNDSTFVIIFTLDENDDPYNPKVWIKANPNLGAAPYLSYMETQARNAKTEGVTSEIEFLTKNNNVWTDTAATWITQDMVKACRSDLADLPEDATLLGALDLSSTDDITAFSVYSPEYNLFRTWFFCPESKMTDRRNSDRAMYKQFHEDGLMFFNDGNVIDYDYVRKFIYDIAVKYYIRSIAYDPFNSSQLVIGLTDDGHDCIKVSQGFASISPPTKELERRIYAKDISYVECPVIEWMFSNVEIKKNADGHIKPYRGGRGKRNKIDGIMSMIMAYGLSMSDEYNDSVYNERGMTVLTADED